MGKNLPADFKVFLALEGEKRLSCNDLFALLENILKHGSISRAADKIGLSYRYSWGLIGAAEKALGLELVHRQVGGSEGGGTTLSKQGSELLAQYQSFKEEIDLQLVRFVSSAAPMDTKEPSPYVVLASTMEPVETGLLDILEKAFFQDTDVLVRHIALGSGRALELAGQGRVDITLTHAPTLEKEFMQSGWGKLTVPVMANDFILVGPPADPAGIKPPQQSGSVGESLRQIAHSQASFISRGDRSGTHLRELELWESAGVTPGGGWYTISSGIIGNMGILGLAAEQGAYTLVDRGAYLLSRSQGRMIIVNDAEEGTALPGEVENIFSLVLVNPDRATTVNYAGALRFARWIQGEKAKQIISEFGRERFGRPLFSSIAPV